VSEIKTCGWPGEDALMIAYHDQEWGVPVHDDRKHFEFLILDAFQAGLSWKTILHRRETMRAAFAGFDPALVASFDEADYERLMNDPGIIRNRLKVRGSITNAQRFLELQARHGTFDDYIWQFTHGKTIDHQIREMDEIPATSPESDEMSRALRKLGFTFVGSTICYAYMQAAGMINDHQITCFRHGAVGQGL
jgi:DNA-3-methyladenine glycosylase I